MKPFSILFSVALLAACGVSPTAAPTTYQDFRIAQSQIACEVQFRCCGTECATNDDTFNKAFVNTQKLIDLGTLVYDAKAGATCIDSARASVNDCGFTANTQPSTSPTCNQVLVGKIAVGQTCDPLVTTFNLCVSGAYCSASASPVCTTYLSDGSNCSMGGRCLSTSYCDDVSETCKPRPKSGQACSASAICDSTGTKLVCLPSMVCGPPAAEKAACASNDQCLSGNCGTGMSRICLPSSTPPSTLRDTLCK